MLGGETVGICEDGDPKQSTMDVRLTVGCQIESQLEELTRKLPLVLSQYYCQPPCPVLLSSVALYYVRHLFQEIINGKHCLL